MYNMYNQYDTIPHFTFDNFRNQYFTNSRISRANNLLGCPKSVFLLQTRLLQQRIFIQTWNLI